MRAVRRVQPAQERVNQHVNVVQVRLELVAGLAILEHLCLAQQTAENHAAMRVLQTRAFDTWDLVHHFCQLADVRLARAVGEAKRRAASSRRCRESVNRMIQVAESDPYRSTLHVGREHVLNAIAHNRGEPARTACEHKNHPSKPSKQARTRR